VKNKNNYLPHELNIDVFNIGGKGKKAANVGINI
jgi:hypothetical protein